MTGQVVFAIFETTQEELVGFHPFADLGEALAELYAFIEAKAVDPSHHFQVLEVGVDDPASSTGVAWYPEPLLRASVFAPQAAPVVH